MMPKHLRVTDKQPFSNGRRPSVKMTKLNEIKIKITSLDNDLTRIVSSYIAKHGKQPNELDLMRDQSAVPLITQRKKTCNAVQEPTGRSKVCREHLPDNKGRPD